MTKKMSVQQMIQTLQKFWGDKGCMLMQSYDTEKGAGTMSLTRSCGQSAQNHGLPLTWNHPVDQLMAVTVKTQTVCTNIINSKW